VKHFDLITRSLVVSDSLLAKLSELQNLTDKIDCVDVENVPTNKVGKLLTVLRKIPENEVETVFTKLLTALRLDGQEHVANIFREESDICAMSLEHFQLLSNKMDELSNFLDANYKLLDLLVSTEVITDVERYHVMCKCSPTAMSRHFVGIIQ
jgi:hypothetical protein